MSKIARIYQGLEEIQKYYQGGVLQRLFFDWKHYIGEEINIEHAKECAGRNVVINGKTYQNLVSNLDELVGNVYTRDTVAIIDTSLFKANTTYTAIITISESNYSYEKYGAIFSIFYPTLTNGYVSISLKDGTFKLKFTTKEETPSKIQVGVQYGNSATSSFKLNNLIVLEGDYTSIDLPNSINGIESVAEKERNLANYIIKAIGTLGERVVFDNKNCLKITSTFSRTIVLDDTSDYQIYMKAYANNEVDKAYSIGNFGGTYIGCGNKTWEGLKITKSLNKFSIYNYQNSEVYIDLDTLSLVRVNNPYPLKLNVRGKNLFNLNNLEYGNMNKDTGKNLADVTSMKRTINYISVNPKTQYIINTSCRFFEYDKDKNFLSSTAITGKFTTSENTEYIKFHGNTTDEFVDDKKIQLEEGTVATSYEPYREPTITNINLPIPLRSLPNGVCDTIEENKLIQRVEKVVLNGSEDWNLGRTTTNTQVFYLVNTNLKELSSLACDTYTVQTTSKDKSIYCGNSWRPQIRDDSCSTIEEFKQLLSEKPVTVYYELATPIETGITPDKILINGEPITDTVGIELPDGTCDSIENDYYYVKRVGKVVLDGSDDEKWEIERTTNNLMNAGILIESVWNKSRDDIESGKIDYYFFSDKLPNQCTGIASTTTEGIMFHMRHMYVRILLSKLSSQDIDGLRNYLSKNPITVWYELATVVKIPLFSIKEGLTTLKSTNNITPQMELDCLVRDDFQNMCDNEWESGDINLGGVNYDNINRIRLVNYIELKPNTIYRLDIINSVPILNTGLIGARFYDSSKKYLGNDLAGNIKSPTYTFTTPADCYYIRFIVETTDTNFKIYLKEVIN